MKRDTIFALSSGHGRAGVAVIRISGGMARTVLERMAPPLPKPRFAAFRHVRHALTGERLDQALVLWLPGPNSETGEDMAELHVHGSWAVIQDTLASLGGIDGCRLAAPGEFARRAFEAGKLDLTGVEGLADLIEAETSAQRRQALQQAEGALRHLYDGWRQQLTAAAALLAAAIDFSDESDVGADAARRARDEVEALQRTIRSHLDDGHRGEIVRQGFQVVLAGPPNAGKSSLLNALARRDAAIVSDEPGTTRDVIEVKLDIGGLPVVVSDTAGIREVTGKVEQEGIRRTLGRAKEADLVLWVTDGAAPAVAPPAMLLECADRVLMVVNKVDLLGSRPPRPLPAGAAAVSALTGSGLDALTRSIGSIAATRTGGAEAPPLTQARHRQHLESCCAALDSFLSSPLDDIELRAEDLRRAALALGRLTGSIDVEDVLGEIFSRFCIGK
jgi:tRNA modification GTPase